MVQKPEKGVYFAPYLLHHSFATAFRGFWAFSKRSKAEVQKHGRSNMRHDEVWGEPLRVRRAAFVYRAHGRFPRNPAEIEDGVVAFVAYQLGMRPEDHNGYDTASRTWKRHRAEVRTLLGFREPTVADAAMLEVWLQEQIPAIGAAAITSGVGN